MEGCTERILPICDVSGSMYIQASENIMCVDVSVALSIYIAEKNEGAFHNCFITFSECPKIITFAGNDIIGKFQQTRAQEGYNTNLQAVFKLIVRRAKECNLSQEDLPTKLLILSDMEIDCVMRDATLTNFEAIDQMFQEAGYKRPGLIFWNIQGRGNNMPITLNDKDCALISGYSPAIVRSVLGGEILTPMSVMLKTVNTDRYSQIVL